jgi:hypothetical protein
MFSRHQENILVLWISVKEGRQKTVLFVGSRRGFEACVGLEMKELADFGFADRADVENDTFTVVFPHHELTDRTPAFLHFPSF